MVFIATLWALPEQRVGLYVGFSVIAILSAAYGLQVAARSRAARSIGRGLAKVAPQAAGVVTAGLALAAYFGLIAKEPTP